MISFNIYTYLGDSALTPYCVRAIRQAADRMGWQMYGDYRIFVRDDGHQPCRGDDMRSCIDLGAYLRPTGYWRRGNLNGNECIKGILQDLSETQDDAPTLGDISVKVDVDTLLLGLDWLRDFRATPTAQITAADDRGNGYGMCYALRPPVINAVLASMTACPAGQMAPEDQTICHRARQISGPGGYLPIPMYAPGLMLGSVNGPDGIAAPWLPDEPDRDYAHVQILNLRATLKPTPQEDILRAAARFTQS